MLWTRAIQTHSLLIGSSAFKPLCHNYFSTSLQLKILYFHDDIEVILASLPRILERSTEEGQAMPSHLWVQVDNAVGKNRNQHVMRMLALLVDKGICPSTVLSTLRVGHTHEDLDAVFGIVTRHIRNELSWDTTPTTW